MKSGRPAIMYLVLAILLYPAFTTLSQAASQDEVMEKIRLLEIQIQQLKALKEQQKISTEKEQQCLKPVGDAKFCKCIAEALPPEVGFEQYVHFLLTPRDVLQYDSMPPESRHAVDASTAAREKCADKGWFR